MTDVSGKTSSQNIQIYKPLTLRKHGEVQVDQKGKESFRAFSEGWRVSSEGEPLDQASEGSRIAAFVVVKMSSSNIHEGQGYIRTINKDFSLPSNNIHGLAGQLIRNPFVAASGGSLFTVILVALINYFDADYISMNVDCGKNPSPKMIVVHPRPCPGPHWH